MRHHTGASHNYAKIANTAAKPRAKNPGRFREAPEGAAVAAGVVDGVDEVEGEEALDPPVVLELPLAELAVVGPAELAAVEPAEEGVELFDEVALLAGVVEDEFAAAAVDPPGGQLAELD